MPRSRGKVRRPMTRSEMMRAVHSKNTHPEMLVRKALFRAGFRYRLYRKDLPGTPDLFVLKYGVAVFVNGCFWHRHGCRLASHPKKNSDFWNEKFTNNVVRDVKTLMRLSQQGIRVAVVWECSLTKSTERTLERLADFILSDEETIEI